MCNPLFQESVRTEVRMKKLITAASVITLFISGVAGAAGTGAAPSGMSTTASTASHDEFTKLDANKDGYLEKKEVRSNAKLEKNFSKAAPGGRMTEAEFAAWETQHQSK
jgi:hypothetical protein